MLKLLMQVAPAIYAFLSGLLVSVATNAAAQVAFAEQPPKNTVSVSISGGLALAAGIVWFMLSEHIGSACRKVDDLAPALKSREAAIESLPRKVRVIGVILFLLACGLSFAWPWAGHLSRFVK